jgi:hypothetical protein
VLVVARLSCVTVLAHFDLVRQRITLRRDHMGRVSVCSDFEFLLRLTRCANRVSCVAKKTCWPYQRARAGRDQVFYSAAVEEVARSRSRLHTFAASEEIKRRRPTSISIGPQPSFFIS